MDKEDWDILFTRLPEYSRDYFYCLNKVEPLPVEVPVEYNVEFSFNIVPELVKYILNHNCLEIAKQEMRDAVVRQTINSNLQVSFSITLRPADNTILPSIKIKNDNLDMKDQIYSLLITIFHKYKVDKCFEGYR